VHIKTPLAVAITLTLAMGAAAPLQAAGQQAVAATGAVAADAVDLDRIEVRAQLESQIRAVDLKRSSNAIEDAVSSDALGQYPDKNVAESLQRLPGISVTRDQGEGRYVVVRGLDANLNSVSVDGIAIGTPDNSSRAAPMDVIPSDSTERLRVVKSPTPDMPATPLAARSWSRPPRRSTARAAACVARSKAATSSFRARPARRPLSTTAKCSTTPSASPPA
jgi:outer membrane receptor protein involved in Fe transport